MVASHEMNHHLQIDPLRDPLHDWGNDDLLLSPTTRALVRAAYPKAFRILDWPRLRTTFEQYDTAAKLAKPKAGVIGKFAAAVAMFGLMLLSLAPLSTFIGVGFQRSAAIFGASAFFVATAILLLVRLRSPARDRWLANRFASERLRQLYFQYIENNIGAALRGMESDDELEIFKRNRENFLDSFCRQLDSGFMVLYHDLLEDEGSISPWLCVSWPEQDNYLISHLCSAELFDALSIQRIQVQREYGIVQTSRWNAHTAGFKASAITLIADALTVFIPILALGSGALFFVGYASDSVQIMLAGFLQSSFGVVIAYARALDQGFRFSDDAQRYRWYLNKIRDCSLRFDRADSDAERLRVLQEVELLAYEEMRGFLISRRRARFFS